MNKSFKTFAFTVIMLFSSLATTENASAQDSTLTRELWSGTFTQNGLVSWKGPMQIYLRYDPEQNYPQTVEGVITWPSLGGARTRIQGQRHEKSLTFKETQCLQTDCAKIVLGGSYEGEYQNNDQVIRGSAKLGGIALLGNFEVKRD